ncbi:hypothetical protein CUJ84_Chr003291 [Rhizobium leguminosarum]|uniref:Uncharacterized protein n=1 Tax=Rhizobium leguminosarum TaxID=384 RepID=A0A2K9Z623_RHILE|nr:hypothetical protein CUJ84_Chr003291 [Rhizobium leguminosarum]
MGGVEADPREVALGMMRSNHLRG